MPAAMFWRAIRGVENTIVLAVHQPFLYAAPTSVTLIIMQGTAFNLNKQVRGTSQCKQKNG
jgi:hypothetical protein